MPSFGSTVRAQDLSALRELSEASKALLADKSFSAAIEALQREWIEQLLAIPHAGEQQNEVAARLRALNAVIIELGLQQHRYREAVKQGFRSA